LCINRGVYFTQLAAGGQMVQETAEIVEGHKSDGASSGGPVSAPAGNRVLAVSTSRCRNRSSGGRRGRRGARQHAAATGREETAGIHLPESPVAPGKAPSTRSRRRAAILAGGAAPLLDLHQARSWQNGRCMRLDVGQGGGHLAS